MEVLQLNEDADRIREVFTYINRFKGSTFVIKIDSSLMNHDYFPILVKDLALLKQNGINMVIIPGSRHQIDEILDTYGIKTEYHDNIRISPPEAIPFIKMAAFDVCNKIMTQLSAYHVSAVIGNWVRARSMGVVKGTDYLNTGKVNRVDGNSIRTILGEGHIPIFPCIGWSSTGEPFNVSSDELAVELGKTLHSKKIFFIENRNILDNMDLVIPQSVQRQENGRISKLTIPAAQELLASNEGTPLPIISLAVEAARAGVDRVHIVNGTTEGVILREIFSNLGVGTMVFANDYERIRPMESADTSAVLGLMKPLIEGGLLIPRSREDLAAKIRDYIVYAVDDVIHGCAALHQFEENQAEIAGLAVAPGYVELGIGQKMVTYLLEQGRSKDLEQIFVLTTQSSDWFLKMGFTAGSLEDLPPSKRDKYNRRRNSRILIFQL
ncbi:MAG: amino-acid N-acetyltransferase [Spirochaetales bacterium]|nr:amino-acid N-acetyltransferase [Spirochaetales bacterium]